ncbi:MAG: MarR family transcriptional regulator [Gemmatimonadota bacterium]|nr:MAG: MarR family transcriptional regulator [Gemmatimonadota bacterium]
MHPAAERLIEQMGLQWESEGRPRIAGRLFALMLLEDRDFTLGELAHTLQASRGSMSTNTRLLESQGVIERVAKSGDRRIYYRLTSDPYRAMIESHLKRMERTKDVVAQARKELAIETKKKHTRLAEIERFHKFAITTMNTFLTEHLKRAT